MTKETKRKRGRPHGYEGRPTTITIYLSVAEEAALSHRAKAQKQSVPAFVGTVVRERLQLNEKEQEQ